MASSSSLMFAFSLLFFAFLFSSVHSLNCTSQKLPSKKVFSNCTDLPTLGAILHYSYDASNSSLSIAYVATPSKPNGWVAWAINPTSTGMLGAQALIAFKANGSVAVRTYNLTSYKSIVESKLSFDVWDLSAEESNGVITILATVKVPEKTDKLNQVWQVGPSVTGGMPDKHEISPSNLGAKSTLAVASGSATNAQNSTDGGKNGGVSVMKGSLGLGFYMGMFLFLVSCVNF